LCVAARYGSTAARAYASTMRAATSVPADQPCPMPMPARRSVPKRAAIGQVRQDAQIHPPAGDLLDYGARASQAVLTMLAPIASRQS